MDCNTPGIPDLHYLLEFAQTHTTKVKKKKRYKLTRTKRIGGKMPRHQQNCSGHRMRGGKCAWEAGGGDENANL